MKPFVQDDTLSSKQLINYYMLWVLYHLTIDNAVHPGHDPALSYFFST